MAESGPSLRILMTTDTLGGVWDYSLELARHLGRRGNRVLLATMGPAPSEGQKKAALAVPGLEMAESTWGLEWMPATGEKDLAQAGEWLLSLEARFHPDLVHLNGYTHAALPWPVPCLLVAHSCVLSWWRAVRGEPAPAEWNRYAERVSRGIRQADAVVAPTGALLREIQALYGVNSEARAIWNGRNPENFRGGQKGNYIFSAGRLWDAAKNLETLAAVAPDLPWPVIAAGDWQRPDGCGSRPADVESIGLLSSQEMAGWFSRAPIYALPARYEPFGLTVLEAALSGCALVLGDIPTLRELWDGVALFVPPDDHRRLRTALRALISDSALCSTLGRAARERALAYSSERMTAAYVELYQELRRRHHFPGSRRDTGLWPSALAAKS